jgi:hypothetical protein
MGDPETLTGKLAQSFTNVIHEVDRTIGENRTYGAGIGPHDEDDQVDALVKAVRNQGLFDETIHTVKGNAAAVQYPGGQAADLVVEDNSDTEYCEVKLLRMQKANEQPSSRGYSKIFNPFQDRNPRSFIHDVSKLAESDVRAQKTFLGIYYRPVNGAGTQIAGEEMAQKFATDVEQWTDHSIDVDTVARFSGLQHEVHQRGAIIVWELSTQPEQYF